MPSLAVFSCFALLLYLLFELSFLAFRARVPAYEHDQLYTAVSRPCVRYDPTRGFRWKPGATRMIRICKDEIVFDQVFRANSHGVISRREYKERKATPGLRRIVVLGDSFSDASSVGTPWPDRLDGILSGEGYEIYSFAVDGGGLANWRRILLTDVLDQFEVDAVILASFVGNLRRGFAAYHQVGARQLFGRFSTIPRSREEFLTYYLPRMRVLHHVLGEEDVEALSKRFQHGPRYGWRWPGLDAHGTKFIVTRLRKLFRPAGKTQQRKLRAFARLRDPGCPMSGIEMERRFGPPVRRDLAALLGACKDRGLPVLLCSIPSREGAADWATAGRKQVTEHQWELRGIARLHGLAYFDGYEVFGAPEAITRSDRLWFKHDGHWTQEGHDLFAQGLATFLRSNGSAAFEGITFPSSTLPMR